MTSWQLRKITRQSVTSAELEALAHLSNVADPLERSDDPPVTAQLVSDRLAQGGTTYAFHHYAVFDEHGRALGAAMSEGAVGRENLDMCEIGVMVDPQVRRQGIASALVEHALVEARGDGRHKVWAWAVVSPESVGFWESRGLALGYQETVSRLTLDRVDTDLMQSWIDQAGDRASGYHLERWTRRCPDELLQSYGAVREAMDDAPTDDLEYEAATWDVERVRDFEVAVADRGQEIMAIMAVETATGKPAGYTAVRVQESRPAVSGQSDTVTIAAHRNRGIGRWLKAEMFQWVRTTRPAVRHLDTENAATNDAMLAINVAMGFEASSSIGIWHRVS